MKFITYTLLFIAFSISVTAQPFDSKKLDSYFDALDSNHKFMGSIALHHNGKTIYTRTVGYADIATKQHPDAQTKYRIGSISKTFTAVLIAKAVEEKKITLSEPIARYFPTIKNASSITIDQLLRHRSGIHNITSDFVYFSYYTKPKTPDELVALIAGTASDFEPGTQTDYSNSNYILLSILLSKVYNMPYEKLLSEKIIKPLGLQYTQFGGKITITSNEANSYTYTNQNWKLEPETDMSVPLGAGGIVSTPSDLNQFYRALFSGKMVSFASLVEMKTSLGAIEMGLFQIPNDKAAFGHTGSIDGFSAIACYFPEDSLAFSLTSNGTNYNNIDITIAVVSAYFNKPYEIPDFKPFSISGKDLDQYLGIYGSPGLHIKITVTKKENLLMAQFSGQAAFPLTPSAKDKFRFDQAGIVIEFAPKEQKLTLKKGGKSYDFTKDPAH